MEKKKILIYALGTAFILEFFIAWKQIITNELFLLTYLLLALILVSMESVKSSIDGLERGHISRNLERIKREVRS